MVTGARRTESKDQHKKAAIRQTIILLLLLYWTLSLAHLEVFPLVGQDEPWIAAAPYKLATEGVFGSDLFAGYYGMERHHYQHLPAFHLLQAGVFRLAGVGVFQMRFLPVTLGLLLLPLTFAVGRQLAGQRAGLLAAALLIGVRLAGDNAATGVPLLDIARINRYDVGVAVFGLAAFWLFNRAEKAQSRPWYLATGATAGLAGLYHMYGLFWLPALLLVLLLRRGPRLVRHVAPYCLLGGALLVWLPWLLYIAAGWQDFLGQQRFVADRFDLFNPAFYLNNLLREIDRYRLLDLFNDSGHLQLSRPGLWTAILGLPLSLLLLWRQRRPRAAWALALVLPSHVLLFALLLKQKHYNYIIAFWPLAMLALAFAATRLWRRRRWRPLLALLLLLLVVESVATTGRRHRLAARTTPYEEFAARTARYIPQESLVLGLQHYWLGLRQTPYRTWLLPLLMADPQFYHQSLTLDQALERVDPDVVLIDRHMGALFATMADPADPDHDHYLQFWRFMQRHHALLAGVIDDPHYGRMAIYWLDQGQKYDLGAGDR